MLIFLDIVLNVPVNQAFTYSYIPLENQKPENIPQIGKRAEVRFGNKKMTGFITKIYDSFPSHCAVPLEKIKQVSKIVDSEPLITQELLETAIWVSKYYLCTIGEAVNSILPSARRESSEQSFSFDSEISAGIRQNLSEEQKKAVNDILAHAEKNESSFHYLYGPTGSGKTEVFLQTAEQILKKNKGVIYLVPEISLTQQVVDSVVNRFGPQVAVLHSSLTQSQKLTQWKKILHREARIVIGARSAIFAPVPDLGMIIIDEEHDSSYKSGNTPRYHARQTAMYRASKLKIPLIMGSATPSVEAWHLMNCGKLLKHTLSKRLAGGEKPSIKCINLNQSVMQGCISEELKNEIETTLKEKKQAILFLNRRGFTHFFRCSTCGFEMKCKNCSVSMTFHKSENRLRCHYCGWHILPPSSCPKCGSLDIGYSGFGTEFIEAETAQKFPNARIVRVDTDSVSKKGELQNKIDAFKKGEFDIMLGTQMVAKGLNFPNLKTVGIILADTALHLPDFRATERTFSLITQVAGRAGRFFPDGKVFVQTYNPENQAISFACSANTEGFYDFEINQRKLLSFPPFSRLIRLVFRSSNQIKAQMTSEDAANLIENLKIPGVEILGPSECPLSKISQNYRFQLILRGEKIVPLQNAVRKLLFDYRHPQEVYIECDVDPVSLL
ncbi:MAG: primosomal protein N' [Spirochaetia bacterium]|nr:primosomal protein N' [Spirochaetia bacterium]MDY3886625.1 primosomal protein N' [Treponema sp.]MDY4152824.1 primosomal protein N' [Treponema sp.]